MSQEAHNPAHIYIEKALELIEARPNPAGNFHDGKMRNLAEAQVYATLALVSAIQDQAADTTNSLSDIQNVLRH